MKYCTHHGRSSPKRCRMASSVEAEICGFSAMVERKSPGASWISRNVSAEIPNSSGIVCSNRRVRKVRIRARSGRLAPGTVEDAIAVPQDAVNHRARVHVPEAASDRDLHEERRHPDHETLVVQGLRHLVEEPPALGQVAGGKALLE